ncbi:hypothetical protein RD110_10900 [Rhodoferax koreense]|uniref:Uncharacterized protein n=1 Tax=Rhodoferax koreensis TaxID=1842727 RepID=A0A1P8JV69_9BURK|nr:hypothetical protein [Rhodoferax koreense]APW37635.1 hypothetical protein RD110_10900 [Rhodoferax koreense]
MQKNDFTEFSEMLDAIWSLKGPVPTASQKAMFFRVLAEYPLNEVRAGLDAHVKDPIRGKFLPMPADVIAQIKGIVSEDGRPGAEEAWAMAVRARDEAVTIVWTAEMSEAMGVCQPLVQAGDDVGARMAFKEAYTRLVAQARESRIPPEWVVSLGHDAAGRDSVLLPHVQAGRLSADVLSVPQIGLGQVLALPAPADATPKNLALRAQALQRLAELRDEIAAQHDIGFSNDAERERLQALKAEAQRRVDEYAKEAA